MMNREEFNAFLEQMQKLLGTQVSEELKQQMYSELSKMGLIHFHKFEQAFGKWCDEKIKETHGTDVVHPISLQDPPNKEFNVTLKPNTCIYKKFSFKNTDDYDKQLTITSSNDSILQVRTTNISLKSNNGVNFIRVKIFAPKTPGDYIVQVLILDSDTMEKEELILFRVFVTEGREVSPTVKTNMGININKNAGGGWIPSMRSPSPKRNTPEPR